MMTEGVKGQHSGNLRHRSRALRGTLAFTVIELLVVIAVIAILAGILLAVLPGVSERRVRSTVQAEMRQLITAIEYYKEKHGFYPPDNTNNIAQPPLFYELGGTKIGRKNNETSYQSLLEPSSELTATEVKNKFGGDVNGAGFLNASADESEVKNFIKTHKARQYGPSPFDNTCLVLKVPAKGPKDPNYPTEDMNPWRYIVAKPNRGPADPFPTNNPESFDLWAEVAIGNKTLAIGNWKK